MGASPAIDLVDPAIAVGENDYDAQPELGQLTVTFDAAVEKGSAEVIASPIVSPAMVRVDRV